MPSHSELRLEAAILCEAVRTENTGKQLLIGVYPGPVLVNEFPSSLSLTAYFMLDIPPAVDLRVSFQAKLGNEGIARTGGRVRSEGPGTMSVDMSFRIIDLKAASTLCLLMKVGDEDWEKVLERSVDVPDQDSLNKHQSASS